MSGFAVKSGYYTPSVFSANLTSRSICSWLGFPSVTNYRLTANHNIRVSIPRFIPSVTNYSLTANHNSGSKLSLGLVSVTNYSLTVKYHLKDYGKFVAFILFPRYLIQPNPRTTPEPPSPPEKNFCIYILYQFCIYTHNISQCHPRGKNFQNI